MCALDCAGSLVERRCKQRELWGAVQCNRNAKKLGEKRISAFSAQLFCLLRMC